MAKKKKKRKMKDTLSLPTKPSIVSDAISDYSFMVHGERKIGKTTLATAEENVLVLSFDPLRPGLAILQRHCPDWNTFRIYLRKLIEVANDGDEFPYPRVVVDRVDLAYNACLYSVCSKKGMKHPSDADDYGATWGAVRREFEDAVMKTMALPCGSWFICHSEWKETKKVSGLKTERLVPSLTGQADGVVNGLCDGVFAYCWDGNDRVLVCQGDEQISAGNNLDTHFFTTDQKRVREIYMGNSSAEAWALFNQAFHNKQTYTTIELKREEAKSKVGKKKKKKKKTHK